MKKLFLLKPLQDLLFGLNAVISTNERIEFLIFITGHAIFNGAYDEIFQLNTLKTLRLKKNLYL